MTVPDDLGFSELLANDGLFAGMLGKTRAGRNRDLLYGPDLPVLFLVGGPGMGKVRLLECIRAGFGPHVPTAHIDCCAVKFRQRAGGRSAPRTTVTEVLRDVALQLGAWEGDGGGIATPRLYAGLVAVAVGDERDGNVAGQVGEAERHDGLLPPASFWRGVATKAAKNYLTAAAGLVMAGAAGPLVSAVFDELFTRASQRGRTTLRDCYSAYPGAGGQPRVGLRNLASDFHEDGARRMFAEGFLFRALREDVEAAYTTSRAWLSRSGRPALLLGRADGAVGRCLLTSVLEDRAEGRADRLVVIATARREDGGLFLHGMDGVPETEFVLRRPTAGGRPDWTRPARERPGPAPLSHGALPVRMPLLTTAQQRAEISAICGQLPGGATADPISVEQSVHRLSGGRPASVTRLAQAARHLRREEFSDRALLAACAQYRQSDGAGQPQPEPVAALLLDELVAHELPEGLPSSYHSRWVDLLAQLSVAHDEHCAQAVLQTVRPADGDHLTASRVQELLRDSGWPTCPRHFIGDYGLRQLLLWRLRDMDTGAPWQRVNELLWSHYRGRAPDRADPEFGSVAAHALHHRLSCGDPQAAAEEATDYLSQAFTTLSPKAWSKELLAIAEAPTLSTASDVPAGPDSHEDAVRHCIARLLQALRRCEDHTRTFDDTVAYTIRSTLQHLANAPVPGAAVLDRLARAWSSRAAHRLPLRPCACTRHVE